MSQSIQLLTSEFSQTGNYNMGVGFDQAAHQALEGFRPISRKRDPVHNRRVTEAARLYIDAVNGDLDPFLFKQALQPTHEVYARHLESLYPGLMPQGQIGLREAMSTTDYKALFQDVLDRKYYGTWTGFPIVNEGLCRVQDLQDFRPVDRYLADDAVSPFVPVAIGSPAPQHALSGPVPQGGATLATADTAALQYQPKAYQSEMAVNWQALVNDDLGIFNENMARLALQGKRGIAKFITGLFFDANGPNASLYTAGFGNIINIANGASVNNPPLNAQGLQDALKVLAKMKDSSGEPILITGRMKLVHGPALVATVNNLMNALTAQVSVEGGTVNASGFPSQFIQVNNWLVRNMDPIMDPYLPIVVSGANTDRAWAIVVDPNGENRPAVELGYLKGFRTPQLFTKVPNIQRMGGGIETTMGDYDSFTQRMKIIGVFGGRGIDGRTTVGSNGSGS